MMEKHFFEILVYRLPQELYYEEMTAYTEKVMYPGPPVRNADLKRLHEKCPDIKINVEEHIRAAYGGAWNYNEIIGWIQLHFLGSQIRGAFWRVKTKRLVRSRKKVFEFRTWKLAPEISIPHQADNKEIYCLINKYLDDCRKELNDRCLDTSRLDVIGPYVDWRALIKGEYV